VRETELENPIIRIENLHHTYHPEICTPVYSLNGINLTINNGDYMAIVGANGSGKSTLLRHLNAILLPTIGDVWISEWNTKDSSRLRNIRSTVGMVFQMPETQIVATVVEEDIAFGPENLGIPEDELNERVDWALEEVGITELRYKPTHLLSGGQKQLLAIASALAMKPKCLIFDEATSMLDPGAKFRIINIMKNLNKKGITIITATHDMDEAALAGRIIVLKEGNITVEGKPQYVFSKQKEFKASNLELPYPARIARRISQCFPDFPEDIFTLNELIELLTCYFHKKGVARSEPI